MSFIELTGWPVVIFTIFLTLLVFIAAVVLVPRFHGPGFGKYVVQLISLVLVTVLTLLSIFLTLNKTNQWYGSWADLLSGGDGGEVTTTRVGAVAPPVRTGERLPHDDFTQAQRNPQNNGDIGGQLDPRAETGQWSTFTLPGKHSGLTQKVAVWLPPSYLKAPERAYPVITAFTGFPGALATYRGPMDLGRHIQSAVQSDKLREPIVVVPDVYPGNKDTECLDSDSGNYETFVAEDVVNWTRENLRTSTAAEAWSTYGYSAGGWCSAMFTVRHPDTWKTGVSMAGYFAPEYSPGQQLKVSDPQKYDLSKVVAANAPDISLWFFTGGEDTVSTNSVDHFKKSVTKPTSLSVNISATGAHRMNLWAAQIDPSLEWLGETSPYFAPLPV